MPRTQFDSKIFDIIVAGAGPAGCALASRLSEAPDKEILLIEAGPDPAAPGAEHPDVLDLFAPMASNNHAFQWPGLMAEAGADPGDGSPRLRTAYVQGYGIGGGSNINGMGVDRGQPSDYDEWHRLGAVGWSWEQVQPYFRKLERDLDFSGNGTSDAHGDSGPMPVRRLPRRRWAPFAVALGEALQRKGFPFLEDYTADFREGFASAPTNSMPDRRVSAPMAYLTPEVRARANLTIWHGATVERVTLDGRCATGLRVESGNGTKELRARQIVLSCGAIQSPAVLMRSGIGRHDQLAKHGMTVVNELRGVGENLQNHPCVMLTTLLPRRSLQQADNSFLVQNWLRFSSDYPDCDRADMHLMVFGRCDWHEVGRRVGAVALSVLKSYSKGRVELSGTSPNSSPYIHFNALSDPRDYERLVYGLRFLLELLSDSGVKRVRRQLFIPDSRLVASLSTRSAWNGFRARAIAVALDLPLVRDFLLRSSYLDPKALASDTACRNFVRNHAQVQYHPSGTCRMGNPNDPDTVVDATGRVCGIESLRVADASIFPTLPRAYPHFVVLMAAEKIADAIKAEWQHSRAEAAGILTLGRM